MAILFEVRGKFVVPYPEVLMIEPFQHIWERDTSETKDMAIKEFSYIEFNTSMLNTNPFKGYSEDKREKIVRTELFSTFDPDWIPDPAVMKAIDKVKEFQEEGSLSYRYWVSNKIAAEKMIDFFTDFDINERNEKTLNPIYKPKEITSSLNDAKATLASLKSMSDMVSEEVFEAVKNRSNKVISPFARPESLNH